MQPKNIAAGIIPTAMLIELVKFSSYERSFFDPSKSARKT